MDLGFAAWLRLGSAEAAATETKIPSGTLRQWKCTHPERFRAISRAHEEALAELRAGLARDAWEGVKASVPRLRSIVDEEADARAVSAAARVLSQIARDVDSVSRLDRGDPTAIVEQRDERSDKDLLADITRALNDPTLQAVYAKHADAK